MFRAVDNKSRAYGAADPSFTYSITGFVNGDVYEQSKVQNPNAPLITPTDTGSSSSVGNYTINISQPAPDSPQLSYLDANYVIDQTFNPGMIDQTFNPGMLTITPAPLTITAGNQNWTYGFDAPNAGPTAPLGIKDVFTVSFGQLYNGDKVGSVTLSTNATLSSSSHYNAGTWPITPSAAIGPGLSNYTITYANASTGLTVAPQALSIATPSDTPISGTNKVYDGTTKDFIPDIPIPTLFGTVSGDVVTLASGSAAFADANVGVGKTVTFSGYTISGADAADYALSQPASSTATITAAGLTITITASTQSKTYGFGGTSAALGTPAFTASGLLGSDSVSSVTLSTNATLSSSSNYNAGTWDITPMRRNRLTPVQLHHHL